MILLSISIRHPIFEWYVIRCSSENKHQKDIFSKEIAQRVQNMITQLSSLVNIFGVGEGRGYPDDHFVSLRIFILIMNEIFIQAPKLMRKVAMVHG